MRKVTNEHLKRKGASYLERNLQLMRQSLNVV